MTRPFTIVAAALSITCGSAACSSTITAEPWRPKHTRSDAVERDQQDATPDAGEDESDAGE